MNQLIPKIDDVMFDLERLRRETPLDGRLFGAFEAPRRAAPETPLPRCLLIDWTRFGGGSATGELKRTYFAGFGPETLLHVYFAAKGKIGLAPAGDPRRDGARVFDKSNPALHAAVQAFAPQVIIYRPVANSQELHAAAMRMIRTLGKPWIVWLMDDWPERLRARSPDQYKAMDRDLRELLFGASDRFVICESMAEAFQRRYGCSFKIFRNGASPEQWLPLRRQPEANGQIRIRYAGSLAPDMTRESVLDVAKAVERLAVRHNVSFEIRTHAHWHSAERSRYAGLTHVSFNTSDLEHTAYRQWLVDADILVVTYNFDPETVRYVKYSFANKTPECLASGAAVLAYGPRDVATIDFLAAQGVAAVVDRRDANTLEGTIEQLVVDTKRRAELAAASRACAFSLLDLEGQRQTFREALSVAAHSPRKARHSAPQPLLREATTVQPAKPVSIRAEGPSRSNPLIPLQIAEKSPLAASAVPNAPAARVAPAAPTAPVTEPKLVSVRAEMPPRTNPVPLPTAEKPSLAEEAGTKVQIKSEKRAADGRDLPAIVLGNGPSLKGFNFDRLKPFDVFGMNAAYRYWDQINWYPRYYACLDTVVGASHAEEIARLVRKSSEYGIERFLLRRKLIDRIGAVDNADRIVDFDQLCKDAEAFAALPLTTGSHTLIWAAALGYKNIYLLGVDCNYIEIVPGAERRGKTVLEITAEAENKNYFFAGYQQIGDKFNIPNTSPDLHVKSWRATAPKVLSYGATVLNANLESKVDAFDFCRFEDVEAGGRVEAIPRNGILGDIPPATADKQAGLEVVANAKASATSAPALKLPGQEPLAAAMTATDSLAARPPLKAAKAKDRDANKESAATAAKSKAAKTASPPNGAHPSVGDVASVVVAGPSVKSATPQVAKPVVKRSAGVDPKAVATTAQRKRPSAQHGLGRVVRLVRRHPAAVGAVTLLVAVLVTAVGLRALPPEWRSATTYGVIGNLVAAGLIGYIVFVYSLLRTSKLRRFLLARIEDASKTKGREFATIRSQVEKNLSQDRESVTLRISNLEEKLRGEIGFGIAKEVGAVSGALDTLRRAFADELQAKGTALDASDDRLRLRIEERAAAAEAKLEETHKTLVDFVGSGDAAMASRIEGLLAQRTAELAAEVETLRAELDSVRAVFTKELETANATVGSYQTALTSLIDQRGTAVQASLSAARDALKGLLVEGDSVTTKQLEELVARRSAESEDKIEVLNARVDSVQMALANDLETAKADFVAAQAAHNERVTKQILAAAAKIARTREALTGLLKKGDAAVATSLEALVAQRATESEEKIRSLSAHLDAVQTALAEDLRSANGAIEGARGALTALVEEHDKAAEAKLKEAGEALSNLVERTDAATTARLEELVTQRSTETKDEFGKLVGAVEGRVTEQARAFRHMNASNASRARPHSRFLENSALIRLEKHWSPLFNLNMHASALYYLAHQLCLAEDRCNGRLATTIETAMLRLLAFRSLKGPEVEMIEIGTLFGLGAGLLHRFRGDEIARARLTLVDPMSGYYGRGEPDLITGLAISVETLKLNLRILEVPEEDVTVLQGLSADANVVEAAKQRSYDFALIDGDHSGVGVRRDFELYGPMVREGGLVLFDDYETIEWPEIKPAVDEVIASSEGWEWLGSDWRTGVARKTAAAPSRGPSRQRRRRNTAGQAKRASVENGP